MSHQITNLSVDVEPKLIRLAHVYYVPLQSQ